MSQFAVGEIVILQNATYFEEWDGALAEVLEGYTLRNPMDMNSMQRSCIATYRVMPLANDGFVVNCTPDQLRKLDGPETDSTQSEDYNTESEALTTD